MTAAVVVEALHNDVPSEVPKLVPARRLWLAGLGLLVVQLSWMLVVPAFAGIDEFDHVYRASGVANGQWTVEPTNATRGTGAWIFAESDIVAAAESECRFLPYTTDADCVGTPQDQGTTKIGSGAGRYNPIYYALVGYPALPFEGRATVYAMRAVSAGLCTGLFVAGLFALRRIARTPWAWVGACAAVTPVVGYSSTIVAPNGPEIMAGFAFWCGCLALLHTPHLPRIPSSLLMIVALSGAILVTFRSLGPLWCLLIAAGAVVATPEGFSRLSQLCRHGRFWIAAGAVAFVTLGSAWWILSMKSLLIGRVETDPVSLHEKLSIVGTQLVLWPLQGIAAFPYRNEMASPVVYAGYLVIALVLFGFAVHFGSGRTTWALVSIMSVSALIPAVITFQTMETHGTAWQGRYSLPFAVGLFVVAGVGVGSAARPRALPRVLPLVAMTAVAWSVYGVLNSRIVDSPSFKDGTVWAPAAAFVIALALTGTALLWSPVLVRSRR